MKNFRKGFTIVELLVVIVVIAVLATIISVAYSGISQRAKDSSIQADITQAKKQIEAFYAINRKYPSANNCTNTLTTEICLKLSPGTSLTYTPNSTSNPTSYTLTGGGSNIQQVTYEATGTGGVYIGTAQPVSYSWTHTSSGGASTVVIAGGLFQLGNMPPYASSTHGITYGGIAMTSLGWFYLNNVQGNGWTELFSLINPPSGTQTVTVTVQSSGGTHYLSGNTVSFKNVSSISSATTAFGSGANLSLNLSSGTYGAVSVACFGNNFGIINADSGTNQRWASPSNGAPAVISDARNDTGSNTMGATSNDAQPKSVVGITLKPS